ncbi:conjugal transfer protein TraF [Escherichia coli]|uniref:conjugal transfer protein TraF n=1 Tax=Escherichia coli TaxID=562 RepID=UPI0004248482|nr:conjugal transfer protein TraF [Escherichia coli]MDN1056281.1 hypothetical protein [Escherichia coli]MDN1534713.1 hypothetical protein [Escherichia coli]MDQ4533231.1 conjugal transfer protein TraF [Escherichia coli]
MRKNNTAIIFGSLFFSCSVMAANGTLAPTVVPMVNGGQASIAISNTSPNLFTVPGDRIIAVNSLDGALTNNEQTASGGVVVSVDGVINPLLPDSRTDQGQAQRLGVKYFPAMMLVDPKQGSIRPLSYGFISQDDLAKQFLNVSEDFKPNF